MSHKKQLLDPLGTGCKLIALNFNSVKTKISMQDHVLTLRNPNDYTISLLYIPISYQGAVRWWNEEGKQNICELFQVILRIIKWYMIDDYTDPNSNDIRGTDTVRKLVGYIVKGLEKLQETYKDKDGNVILAIQFYINILKDSLDGTFSDERIPKVFLDEEKSYNNLINYDKLKSLWKLDKLERICDMYDKCFQLADTESDKNKKENDTLVESYLQSIYKLLEYSDEEFQKLVQNSNKG